MTTSYRDGRTIKQILFSRKREVDIWPALRGNQEIRYPARRNPNPVGYLSAMLCKACVVALLGGVLEISEVVAMEPGGNVYIRSKSQSSGFIHQCLLLGKEAYLTRENVTYHLGLLFLAQALVQPDRSKDLLDALEEILEYREKTTEYDPHYDQLLMHLSDELYYWARYRDSKPAEGSDLLDDLKIRDARDIPGHMAILHEIDPRALTDLNVLRRLRRMTEGVPIPITSADALTGAKFRGSQLPELIESLEIGMNCMLVGPTATGKSLCAMDAFERLADRPVFVIEGHESLREFDLLGGYTPDREGRFTWNDGTLVKAMRVGGFLFIDEANRMPTRTLNVLLGVLSRGAVVLTEHGSEEVRAEEGFQVVVAMNLGQGYAVNSLDRALLDRFPCVLEFRYLSPIEEQILVVEETGIGIDIATIMVNVANETRKLRRNRELSAELTLRGLFAWAKKFQVKHGSILDRLQDSASTTWLYSVAGYDSDGYLREDVASSLLSLIEAHTGK